VRIGEALALSWGNIDLEGAEVHIRKTLTQVKGERPKRTAPKTSSAIRTIPLKAGTVARLKVLRSTLGAIPDNTAPVFISKRAGPLHAPNLDSRSSDLLLAQASESPGT